MHTNKLVAYVHLSGAEALIFVVFRSSVLVTLKTSIKHGGGMKIQFLSFLHLGKVCFTAP